MDNTKNTHINEYLDYYLSLPASPEFAVLLRGKWGSGKSWFINKFINRHGRENFLYVSLYGIKDYKEIEDAFFEQLHPLLASKNMRLAGKLLKSFLKTAIKLDFDEAHKGQLSLNTTLPDINLPDYMTKLAGRTIIFDDLERCAMPIHQILGYINQFVEYNGMKVILIANEEEIIKADKEEEKNDSAKRYLTIKEKLIGKSFDIKPDQEAALNDFITGLECTNCRVFLHKNTFLVTIIFLMAGYQNLRHLRQALLDYDRFYQLLGEDVIANEGLMKHLLQIFLVISFELKKGAIVEEELISLFSYSIVREKDIQSNFAVIKAKYPIMNEHAFHPLSAELLTELFRSGTIDPGKLNGELRQSSYLSKEQLPEWKRLYFFDNLEETEFEEVTENVYKEFLALTMDNPYEVIQVVGLLIYLANLNLAGFKIDELISLGKENLVAIKDRGQLEKRDLPRFPGDHSHSLGYAAMGVSEFKEFLIWAADLIQQNEIDSLPKRAGTLHEILKSSAVDFQETLDHNKATSLIYTRAPVLKYIDPKEFVELWISLPNKDKITVSDTLATRYSYAYDSCLQPEREWLIALKRIMLEKMETMVDRLAVYNIEKTIIPELTKSIDLIPD